MPDQVLAIDVGGTKMAAAIVAADGSIVARRQAPTPPTEGLEDAEAEAELVWEALVDVLEAVHADHPSAPLMACGVGCGGPMAPGGEHVSPLNIKAWRQFPLRPALAELTGLPTFVDNDAKAIALGEGWRGRATGHRDFIGMVVSTGIGGGIVLDGRLLDGSAGNAGHIGHVLVVPDGRPCGCGARGCLEAEASGLAIEAITGRAPAQAPPELVARTGQLVGRAVASVANLLDLPLAVVGGSVALGFGQPFFAAAQAELDRSCRLDFSRGTAIGPVALGQDAPLVGAAAVAWRALGRLPIDGHAR